MRLMFDWQNAMRVPPTIETKAKIARISVHIGAACGSAVTITRSMTAMPAAFEHMASSAVTGAGAPS